MASADMFQHRSNELRVITQRREPPVLVCGKCLARHPKGKKMRVALRRELKQRDLRSPLKRPRLIETSCFGICPKDAIVLASERMLRRRAYVLLTSRKQADEAIDLLLEPEPPQNGS